MIALPFFVSYRASCGLLDVGSREVPTLKGLPPHANRRPAVSTVCHINKKAINNMISFYQLLTAFFARYIDYIFLHEGDYTL